LRGVKPSSRGRPKRNVSPRKLSHVCCFQTLRSLFAVLNETKLISHELQFAYRKLNTRPRQSRTAQDKEADVDCICYKMNELTRFISATFDFSSSFSLSLSLILIFCTSGCQATPFCFPFAPPSRHHLQHLHARRCSCPNSDRNSLLRRPRSVGQHFRHCSTRLAHLDRLIGCSYLKARLYNTQSRSLASSRPAPEVAV
jgi:hypothetical protein